MTATTIPNPFSLSPSLYPCSFSLSLSLLSTSPHFPTNHPPLNFFQPLPHPSPEPD